MKSYCNLRLDKSSVSDGETNGKGDDASNKSSSVSNEGSFIDICGVGGNRGDSSGESGNSGGTATFLGFLDGFRHVAGSKRLESNLAAGRHGSKRRGAGKHGSKDKNLAGLHFISVNRKARSETA